METKYIIGFAIIITAGFLATIAWVYSSKASSPWSPVIKDSGTLASILNDLCREFGQPAMATALVQGRTITMATVGSTVAGAGQPVSEESRFHIGSTTKSFTALLIQMLVEEGKLRYDMTLEEALPGYAMLDAFRKTTLHDLLLSRAGVIPFQRTDLEDPAVAKHLWEVIPSENTYPLGQRREVSLFALGLQPIAIPGTKSVYSNVGWAIAGHIAELAAKKSYESLVRERIFEPLGMEGACFGGWPASTTEPDQPRGHYPPKETGQQPIAQALEDVYIFPEWMNPSGGIHCTIADFALYAREHLSGLQGNGTLLSTKGYNVMHSLQVTVELREMYQGLTADGTATLGYGWAVIPVEGNNLSAADGTGGTFFARILIYPALNIAYVGFTNCGNGSRALDKSIERITGFQWDSGS